jgi:hypothetical protein
MRPVTQLAQVLMIAEVEQRRKLDARPSSMTVIHRLLPTVTFVLGRQSRWKRARSPDIWAYPICPGCHEIVAAKSRFGGAITTTICTLVFLS